MGPIDRRVAVHRLARAALAAVVMMLVPRAWAVSSANGELQAALRATPDLARGEHLFETCAACHGPDGGGAPDGSVPTIAGQHRGVILKQLVDFRHDTRINIRMQHFVAGDHLPGAQALADVAAYVASLPPRSPAVRSGTAATAAMLDAGRNDYARLCQSCHGPRADGDDAGRVPRLAGQHVEYLTQQLADAAEGRRPSMGRDHARTLMRLDRAELGALAAYLASLEPQGAPAGAAGRSD
jgi:cytochrome c553